MVDPDAGTSSAPEPELAIDPPSQTFGSVAAGSTSGASTFTITNAGDGDSGALSTSLEGEFAFDVDSCDGAPLGADESCEIAVVFAPEAPGEAVGALAVTGGDGLEVTAELAGTGIAPGALTVDPTPHDYQEVLAGEVAEQDFTVTNDGGVQTGTITASVGGGDATAFGLAADGCSGAPLGGGESCTLTVEYKPEAAGEDSTTLTVDDSAGDPITASLSGTALDQAALAISPIDGPFGTVVVDETSGEATFTVTNDGDVDSGELSAVVTGDAFTVTDDTCGGEILAADQSCAVSVQFAPASAGERSGSLEVTATPGGTASAALSGEAVVAGDLRIGPTPVSFDPTTIGDRGGTEILTVENTGGTATGAIDTDIVDANATSFELVAGENGCEGRELAPQATCTIEIAFAPQTAGDLNARVRASASPGGSPSASLTGVGLEPPAFEIDPASHDFGSVGVGQPQTFDFTVTNIGDAPTGTPAVGIASGDFNQYSQTNNCTVGLDADESCTVTVAFDPLSVGTKSATLAVSADPGQSGSASLTGEGVDPAALNFQGGSSLSFADTVAGYESAESSFTVVNNGDVSTGALAVAVDGDAAAFAVTDGCGGEPLGPGASCDVAVRFAPGSAGDRAAGVVVTADPPGEITGPVSGTALAKLSIVGDTSDDDGSFAPVAVGLDAEQTFTVVNRGELRNLALAVDPADQGFSVEPESCAEIADGGSCTVAVTFDAIGEPGSRDATLTVNGDGTDIDATTSLALSGSVEGALAIEPGGNVDFGEVHTEQVETRSFTVTNEGGDSVGTLATAIAGDGDFALLEDGCAGTDLPPGDSCSFRVELAPASRGGHDATVTVTADPGGEAVVDVSGTGLAPANVSVEGDRDFGDVIVTRGTSRTFGVVNTGDVDVAGFTTELTGDGTFAVTGDTCAGLATLAAGTGCSIEVELAPGAGAELGTRTAVLSALGSDAVTGGDVSGSADLTGEVVSQLVIDPEEVSFPDTVEGERSAATVFSVENAGTERLDGVSASIDSGDVGAFARVATSCSNLDPAETCEVEVVFEPSAPGAFGAVLTSSVNQGAFASATLAGIGLQQGTITSARTTLEFGGIVAGSISATRTVSFENTGDVDTAELGAATLASTADFAIVSDGCAGSILAPGGTCDVVARFAPDSGTRGGTATELTVGDGIDEATVPLGGTALAPNANLVLVPSFAEYEDTAEGNESEPVTFTLTNNASVGVSPVVSADAGGFTVDAADCGALAAGASCEVIVTFAPIAGDGALDYEAFVIADSGDGGVDDAVAHVSGTSLEQAD